MIKRLQKFSLVILTALPSLIVGIIYLRITRNSKYGFDWTDEAWATGLIQNNQITHGEPWGFHHAIHPFSELFNLSVLNLRYLRILIYALVGAFTGYALTNLAPVKEKSNMQIFAFPIMSGLIGGSFAWVYPPRYISYNELSSWITQLIAGMLIIYLSNNQLNVRLLRILWIFIGALSLILIFTKITSGIIILLIIQIVIFLRIKKYFVSIQKFFWTGFSLALFLFALVQFPIKEYLINNFEIFFIKSERDQFGHPISSIFQMYIDDLTTTVKQNFVIILLIFAFIYSYSQNRFTKQKLVFCIQLVLFIFTAYSMISIISQTEIVDSWGIWQLQGRINIWIFAATLYAVYRLLRIQKRDSMDVLILTLLVVAAPFIAIFGTNNLPSSQVLFSLSIWLSAISIFLYSSGNQPRFIKTLFVASFSTLIGLAGLHQLDQNQKYPYRTTNLLTQQSSLKIKPLNNILVSENEFNWATWLNSFSNSHNLGQVPTISVGSPGALLNFNNSAFTRSWIDDYTALISNSIQNSCKTWSPKQGMLILVNGNSENLQKTMKSLAGDLTSCGIDLEVDFQEIGSFSEKDPHFNVTILKFIQ